MRKQVHLTSGYHIERFPEFPGEPPSTEGLHSLAIFGPRGGYIGLLKYRDEDTEKIISTIKEIASDTTPEGQPT